MVHGYCSRVQMPKFGAERTRAVIIIMTEYGATADLTAQELCVSRNLDMEAGFCQTGSRETLDGHGAREVYRVGGRWAGRVMS